MESTEPAVAATDNGSEPAPAPKSAPEPRPADALVTWVRNHPTASVMIAAGAGLLIGRLLADALATPPPPTRLEQLRRQALNWGDTARSRIGEAGDTVAHQATRTAHEAGHRLQSLAESIPSQREMLDFVTSVGEAVRDGVTRGIERKISEVADRVPLPSIRK